jgi:hypothetical protein
VQEYALGSHMSNREERLQIMLTVQELRALDDFRFQTRMPSRAAAVREIIRRGLAAEGFSTAPEGQASSSFGVIDGGSNSKR